MAKGTVRVKPNAVREPTVRQALASALTERLPESRVSWKFGNASLEVKGKVFAFTRSNEGVAMKLPEMRVQELVAMGAAKPLCMGTRTMREWIVVEDGESEETLRLVEEAQVYVASLAKTAGKPSKVARKSGR